MFEPLLNDLERTLRASLDTCVTGMVATARAQLEAAHAEVAEERVKGLAEVAVERAELHREMEAMQTHKTAQEGRVVLNIGGHRFETSVQTLRRLPHTFFDAYFSGRYAQDVCSDGSIFIDRDGEHFGYVLEYMRDGVVSVAVQEASELNVRLLRKLKREFGFYCIELMADPEEVVYLVGGHIGDGKSLPLLERYDNTSGMWMEATPMMTARSWFGLCEFGGMLYASGGIGAGAIPLVSVECYDPTLDNWSATPALRLPKGRFDHSACAASNVMYVVGGVQITDGGGFTGAIAETTSVLKFDRNTQAWNEVAPMPQSFCSFDTCVVGSNIFVFGKFRSSDDAATTPTATFCFNTAANIWTTLAPMPETTVQHSACTVSGLIYVTGGIDDSNFIVDSVHRFDPLTNSWSTVAPMLRPRAKHASFVLDGYIYVAGGGGGPSSCERYCAISDSWEIVSDMALRTARVNSGAVVMRLEKNLFDSLEVKAKRVRN
jgi:hypothetical protein